MAAWKPVRVWITAKHPVESRKGALILGLIWTILACRCHNIVTQMKANLIEQLGLLFEKFPTTVQGTVETRHSAQSQATELANFDDNEGHVVGERAMPPGSHAFEDRLPHFHQWELCGI